MCVVAPPIDEYENYMREIFDNVSKQTTVYLFFLTFQENVVQISYKKMIKTPQFFNPRC